MNVNIFTPWQLTKGTCRHHIEAEMEVMPRRGEILCGKKLVKYLKKEAEELEHVEKRLIEARVGGCYCSDKLIYVANISHNLDNGTITIELTSHEDGSAM